MTRKEELIKLFRDYKTQYEGLQAKKSEINNNPAYTPEGREMAIQELVKSYNPLIQSYQSKAVELIDGGLNGLSETWKSNSVGRLADSGYQAGLANVIKMLEVGAIQEKEELQYIVDTYAGDFNALSMIKKMTNNGANHNNEKLKGVMFPVDNRVKNRELLDQLKGNVNNYINENTIKIASKAWNTFNNGTVDVVNSMDSMAEFVENRLGDNLELLD